MAVNVWMTFVVNTLFVEDVLLKNIGSDHESKRQYTDFEFATEKGKSEIVSFFLLYSFYHLISPEVALMDMFTISL